MTGFSEISWVPPDPHPQHRVSLLTPVGKRAAAEEESHRRVRVGAGGIGMVIMLLCSVAAARRGQEATWPRKKERRQSLEVLALLTHVPLSLPAAPAASPTCPHLPSK